jgi:hypothetical protein
MQRDQLADFLRRRREAIRPVEVGIADGPRRRTSGLRVSLAYPTGGPVSAAGRAMLHDVLAERAVS